MPWGLAASAAVGLYSANRQSSAARSAANTQANAANQAAAAQQDSTNRQIQMLQDQYQQGRTDLQPYRQSGMTGLSGLNALAQTGNVTTDRRVTGSAAAPDAATIMQDPGVQYRMDQAQKALSRTAAANGSLYGGGYLADLNALTQNLASQEYGNAYNRWQQNDARQFGQNNTLDQQDLSQAQWNAQNNWNRFGQLAQMGLTAAGTSASGAQAFGQNATNAMQAGTTGQNNLTTSAANASAAGTVGASNAWNGYLSSLGSSANSYWGNQQADQRLNQYLNAMKPVQVTPGTSNPAPLSLTSWGTGGSPSWS